jgi:hypothetical protein
MMLFQSKNTATVGFAKWLYEWNQPDNSVGHGWPTNLNCGNTTDDNDLRICVYL